MNSSNLAVPFDFTKPSSLSSSNVDHWRHWLDGIIRDFREKWNQTGGGDVQVVLASQSAVRFETTREEMARPAIAKELYFSSNSVPSILIFERPLALGLVFQLLGEESAELPSDRSLSEIELSVCDLLFQKLSEAISESWPQKTQLLCELKELDQFPHRSRLWEPRQKVFACTFEIKVGESGTGHMQWILPLSELESQLQTLEDERVEPDQSLKKEMEQRVHDLPVSVAVELGSTDISVARLANLKEGDILVFDQRISDPLPFLVDSKVKFFGWLGRTGSRQAFKVSELR